MKCLNKAMVIGYVGRDPEMRYMPSGRPVTSFSVGATRTWTDAEGERREVVVQRRGVGQAGRDLQRVSLQGQIRLCRGPHANA